LLLHELLLLRVLFLFIFYFYSCWDRIISNCVVSRFM